MGYDTVRRKKVPFTKRRKHPILANPSSLDNLPYEALEKVMCKLDITTLFEAAALNKRVNAIFRSPYFFRRCIAPYLSPHQRTGALVKGHNTVFKHDTDLNDDFYSMKTDGKPWMESDTT